MRYFFLILSVQKIICFIGQFKSWINWGILNVKNLKSVQ